jgi:hypothetical protein
MRGRLVVVEGPAEVAHYASARVERRRRGALRRLPAGYGWDTASASAVHQEIVTVGSREAAHATLSFLAREGIHPGADEGAVRLAP